jgi:predicted membrane channel-forming protein YqfA (hemolysin III family)
MTSEHKWIERATGKFLSLFTRKEVKTPLAFFFSIAKAYSAVLLAALYLVGPDGQSRVQVFEKGLLGYLVLFVGVYMFAWFNPKHLVYGETGHRAESRFALGTEQREIEPAELAALEGTTKEGMTTDPKSLPISGGA